mgnify:CR=1 FL=1
MNREPAKDRMIEYLPPYYQASRVMRAILLAQGQEIDALYEALDQTLDQFFISTATWGLSRWEDLLNLPVNETSTAEERRQRVLAKRRGVSQPLLIILRAIAPALEARFGGDIIPFVLPIGHNASEYDFGLLVPTLEIRKPAHKGYTFQLLPPDQSSGYTIYAGRNAGRGKVAFQPEAGAVYAGRWPRWNSLGRRVSGGVVNQSVIRTGECVFPIAGVSIGSVGSIRAAVKVEYPRGVYTFPRSGMNMTGEIPQINTFGTVNIFNAELAGAFASGECIFPRCGELHAGEVAA